MQIILKVKSLWRKTTVMAFHFCLIIFFLLFYSAEAFYKLVNDHSISYSTYLGGSTDTVAYGVAVDHKGNVHTTGYTRSFDFPVTDGAYQKSNIRFVNSFFARISNSGSLLYATYIGGDGFDNARDIAVDSEGNIYITGCTDSTNFPVKNALQWVNRGMRDVFIIKFNSDGSLAFSTYLGGSGDDVGNGIRVDSEGNIYVTGRTTSSDFPLKNPWQQVKAGEWDVFVIKINAKGDRIIYSTYLGGSHWDEGRSIAVDSLGNVFITGYTSSADFPTKRPLQKIYGGNTDAFLAKLDAEGSLVYSTYLGGKGVEWGNSIATDSMGNVYITGFTESEDFPVKNPLQAEKSGDKDAFIININSEGDTILFSTFLGGGDFDNGRYLALDCEGNIYITGITKSKDFPLMEPLQGENRGDSDVFITKISSKGDALLFSTFLGGSSADDGSGIAISRDGSIYVAGTTESKDFPTKNEFQRTNSDLPYAFITKINQNGFEGKNEKACY
jgi:hypothetical protein